MEQKDIEILKSALNNCPDVRKDKVNEIKRKIKDGYSISNEQLADKLIERFYNKNND